MLLGQGLKVFSPVTPSVERVPRNLPATDSPVCLRYLALCVKIAVSSNEFAWVASFCWLADAARIIRYCDFIVFGPSKETCTYTVEYIWKQCVRVDIFT